MDLKRFIRDIPDFPQPGILFRDITPLLKNPEALRHVIDRLTGEFQSTDVDAIVSIESRGFLFGAPLAYKLGVPLVPVRKPGKLPSNRMTVEYSLEYGTGQLDIHQDALEEKLYKGIDDEQFWYWNPKWQEGEVEADLDRHAGDVKHLASVEDLIRDLR